MATETSENENHGQAGAADGADRAAAGNGGEHPASSPSGEAKAAEGNTGAKEPESLLSFPDDAKNDGGKTAAKAEGSPGGKDAGMDGKDGKDGGGGEKGKDSKDGEEKPEAGAAPITAQDLKIPEGKAYDEEIGKPFLDLVNDASIPREVVQKLLDMHSELQDKTLEGVRAAEAAYAEKFKQEEAEWLERCKKDSEFGGKNYDASKAVIARGCARLATKEAIGVLNALGVGAHPEIVRMFYRAGKLVGEDQTPGGSAGTPRAPGEALYQDYRKSLERAGIGGNS